MVGTWQRAAGPDDVLSAFRTDDGELLALLLGWATDDRIRKRILVDNPPSPYDCPRGVGAKRTASGGERLLDPRQVLFDAIQARVNSIRAGEPLPEDAVEKALIRDAAVCVQGDVAR